MYKIIGGDHKEYGPTGEEEMRRWIAEGRLSDQSLVQAEGTGEWRPLGTFAEFAEALAAQVRSTPEAGAVPPPVTSASWGSQLLARQPRVRVGRCLSSALRLLLQNFGLLLGASFLVWAIQTVCQINVVTGMVYGVLKGALYGGYYLVILKCIRGQPTSPVETFAGFRLAFTQLVLAGFISNLLSGVGCCMIVPGIYLFIAWIFCVPLVMDKQLEFWSAMELSRRVVTRAWFRVFFLVVLAFLPVIVMNLILMAKIRMMMTPVDLQAISSGDLSQMLEQIKTLVERIKISPALLTGMQVVVLLNLPFAAAALMYAYEDLFGTRPTPDA